jgi:cytochrome c553
MTRARFAWAALLLALPAMAADPAAGRARATTVCAACHGAQGVSVAAHIPHLAGQRADYLEVQLEAFRDGSRKNAVMNAIARQLSAEELPDLAAYFSSLPAAAAGASSPPLQHLAGTRIVLPRDFNRGHTRYLVKDHAETKQVAHYFATPPAMAAAAEGRPLPEGSGIFVVTYAARLDADGKPVKGADGHFIPERVLAYAAMAREAGWGDAIPDLLRNENWNYALFNAQGEPRASANQAECLACHKPQATHSYLFLHKELAAAARR